MSHIAILFPQMERLRQRVAELEAKLEQSRDDEGKDEDGEFGDDSFTVEEYGDGGYDSPTEEMAQSPEPIAQLQEAEAKEVNPLRDNSATANAASKGFEDDDGEGSNLGEHEDPFDSPPGGAQGSSKEAGGRAVHGEDVLGAPLPAMDSLPAELRKICRNLHATTEKSKWVVIVSCGAYNPVHLMHLRAFYIARQFFAHHTDYRVIGGIMSPSHDTLVRHKTRRVPKEMMSTRHRLGMCRAAAHGSSWISGTRHV
jgi:hypothetical protein